MRPGDFSPELERLPGVLAATVFPDSPNGPRVYLAVHPDADEDAIRATAAALLRDRGLGGDLGRIHIGAAPAPPPTPSALPQLALDALDVHRTDNRVECGVRLRTPNRACEGAATEPDTPAGRTRAAARATLAAAEVVDPDLRLGLHTVREYDLAGHGAILILVEASLGRSHVHLPGAALVERSLEHAAALATLRALRSWGP